MTNLTTRPADRVAPPAGLPRLIPVPVATDLASHVGRLGPMPRLAPHELIARVTEAGLRGRGGAGFPTGVKLAAVVRSSGRRSLLSRRGAVVVANATEGEPASLKDATLLSHAPHLVLDGVVAAAAAVGADEAIVCVDRDHPGVGAVLEAARRERRGADGISVQVVAAPSHYVSGEESALVQWLNGGDARPTTVPPRPFERGVEGRATLVDNVETLAQLALVARFGSEWYRSVGTADDPGSFLATITDGSRRPGVFEVAYGRSLAGLLTHAGVRSAGPVLLGGYFGSWLEPDAVARVRLTRADLAPLGASIGCGVVAVLPPDVCPLREIVRVARWLASESAGQCGPCVHGLDAVATQVEALFAGDRDRRGGAEVGRLARVVAGRGACKMPDGALKFVTTGLAVHRDHVEMHRHGRCRMLGTAPVLPIPRSDAPWR